MNRLTKKDERMVDDVYDCLRNVNKIYNKLADVEDIEGELGIDLITLYKAAFSRGFYYKNFRGNNEICYSGLNFIIVNNSFVSVKPCYEVKELTLESCYDSEKYPSPNKKVEGAHYWEWRTCLYFNFKDYGKTWALTREELENE